MVKLRLTLTCEYEANPENYGTDAPARMAEIDIVNLADHPEALIEALKSDLANLPFELKVEPTDG